METMEKHSQTKETRTGVTSALEAVVRKSLTEDSEPQDTLKAVHSGKRNKCKGPEAEWMPDKTETH